MTKHRRGSRPNMTTPAALGARPPHKTPTSYETFAALGVLLGMLLSIAAIGAVLGAWF